jgi:hypothetical protein
VDEPVADPVPPKSTGPFGAELLLPLVDEPVPDPEPPKSTGPFGVELPVPLVDEPVPEPEPPKSTGPFGVELPLPLVDEPVPEPVPLKSTGPFGVELPLPLVDEPVPDPVPLRGTGPFGVEVPVPAAEPSVGLPPLKTNPGGEETPGSKTAVIDPKPPKESCPNPASIARDSRRSITASRGACVRRGGVLWCCADSLVRSSNNVLKKAPPPLLGSTVGQAFFSVNELVCDDFPGQWKCWSPQDSPGKAFSPGDEGPAMRFRLANGDDVWRSNLGAVPDRSSPSQTHPPEARSMATIPTRTVSGRRCQTATTSARPGGKALDSRWCFPAHPELAG